MNKFLIIFIIILVITSFFVGFFINSLYKRDIKFQENTQSLTNKKTECESQGGIWVDLIQPSGVPLDEPFCSLPSIDYGKKCNDSNQCLGNCEPPREYYARKNGKWIVSYWENITGTCSRGSSKTCFTPDIINGTLDLNSWRICAI